LFAVFEQFCAECRVDEFGRRANQWVDDAPALQRSQPSITADFRKYWQQVVEYDPGCPLLQRRRIRGDKVGRCFVQKRGRFSIRQNVLVDQGPQQGNQNSACRITATAIEAIFGVGSCRSKSPKESKAEDIWSARRPKRCALRSDQ
jgi:hypothetical protein